MKEARKVIKREWDFTSSKDTIHTCDRCYPQFIISKDPYSDTDEKVVIVKIPNQKHFRIKEVKDLSIPEIQKYLEEKYPVTREMMEYSLEEQRVNLEDLESLHKSASKSYNKLLELSKEFENENRT